MTEEMKRLQRKINGKRVIRYDNDWPELGMDAILLWEPNGEEVSLKPYGYEPEELYMLLNDEEDEWRSLDFLSSPSFCFSTFRVNSHNMTVIRNISKVKEGDIFDFSKVAMGESGGYLDPSCPYG